MDDDDTSTDCPFWFLVDPFYKFCFLTWPSILVFDVQINGCEVQDREKAVALLSSEDIRSIILLVTRPEIQVNTHTPTQAPCPILTTYVMSNNNSCLLSAFSFPSNCQRCLCVCVETPNTYIHSEPDRFLTRCCHFSWRRRYGWMTSNRSSWKSWRWRSWRREGGRRNITLTGKMRWEQQRDKNVQ